MKKVLIICYYWPPSGGSGVQRWLKFVRYLREFGWEPVVYTAENGEYPELDPELEKEVPAGVKVIRTPIWEPYKFYKRFTGQKANERVVSGFLNEKKKPGLTSRISMWIRGNFFIPDARKFWIKPSVKYLTKYLKENPVDAIVSTGPPHSMHLIARGLQKNLGVPWLADFRDPWTNIDFYKDLMLSRRADRIHHRLEKEVVENATRVVVIGKTMAEEFREIVNRNIDVVTNGYDEADLPKGEVEMDKKFTLSYIGMFSKSRNHEILWQVLSELVKENPRFAAALQLKLVGKIDASVKDDVEKYQLVANVEYVAYMRHPEAIRAQAGAQVLLLLINNTNNAKGILTGKIFEYLAARRPVICIGPEDGDAAEILAQAGAGETVGFADKNKLKRILADYFAQFEKGALHVAGSGYEKYSRRALTGAIAGILDEIRK